MTGCSSLFPARVEHFQKKVKPVPVLADQPKLVEAQKQAAQFVDKKVAEAQTAAAATSADVSVQVPLAEAADRFRPSRDLYRSSGCALDRPRPKARD
jgi:hypothetical protein